MRILVALSLLLADLGMLVADETKNGTPSGVRILDVKVAGAAPGKATEPTVITSAEMLAKAVPDEKAVAAVKKLVNFEIEKLVYFSWSGSGQDRVTIGHDAGKKGQEITFEYRRGRTRDFRPHKILIAIPRDSRFKVVTVDS